MPRFVILEHDHPELHWDFMLEVDGGLRTWRLTTEPCAGEATYATPLSDHRLAYLDYEGPVSGNRGKVCRWDRGEYEVEVESEACLTVRCRGVKVRGSVRLSRMPDGWEWIWRNEQG
jgi:hypothetical protein